MDATDDNELSFLFTDVVGSTRLWEHRPTDMVMVMERHDGLLESAFAAHAVETVKNTGDGFMAVFGSADEAVAAAVDAQRALRVEPWPDGLRLEVRAGIHTGSAMARSGDFFGSTVNRAARVAQVAHGEQIIVSAATADAARKSSEYEFEDLGTHRLRDLSTPEHLLQVTASGLVAEFPPPLTLDHFRHNLPVERGSFIGRTADLAAVRELVDSHRLVTLRGVGGAGKTRLAIQVAAEALDDTSGGVWLVRLDTIDSPDAVAQAVAAAVGATAAAGASAEQALVDWGRNRSAVLLLDNCEHVIQGVAHLCDYLLERCPALHLLATSREVIGIEGESVYEVGPLAHETPPGVIAESDSSALFLERAREVIPNLKPTDEEAGLIAEICRRLDGIPLALELAAARLNVLSLPDLALRLEDRFQLLAGGRRTALPRHRTLQAAMDWSYDLLAEDERLLFDRLSVFRGGFTYEAAEGVAGSESLDVVDTLARLADRSMVTVDQVTGPLGRRFGMLETLREFGHQRLAARGEVDRLQEAHAAYFTQWTAGADLALHGGEEDQWTEAIDADYANLRRAITRGLGLGALDDVISTLGNLKLYFIARDELMPEVRGWIDQVVAADPAPSLDLARALSTGGVLAWSVGDLETADRLHRRSLDLARQLDSRSGIVRATGDLGLVAIDRGAQNEARDLFTEGLELARRGDVAGDVAVALSHLAGVEEPSRQADLLDEALRIHVDTGRPTGIAHVHLMRGWLELTMGQVGTAVERFEAARDGFDSLANQGSVVVALCGLADAALLRGALDEAVAHVEQAEQIGEALEWPGFTAVVATRRAALARDSDPAWCMQELAVAAAAWEESGLDAGLAENAGLRALVALDLGDDAAAAQWSTLSRDRWGGLGRNAGIAWAGGIVALVEQARAGAEASLPLHAGSLTNYAVARFDPLPLDAFLAPASSSLAARVDAVERAGICAVRAKNRAAGSYAIDAASRERTRTGMVRAESLQESLDRALENSTLPSMRSDVEGFDDVLARLVGMLEPIDPD